MGFRPRTDKFIRVYGLVKDNLTNESVTKFIFVSPKKSQLYFDLMPDKDVVFVFDRNTNLEREAPSFIVKY